MVCIMSPSLHCINFFCIIALGTDLTKFAVGSREELSSSIRRNIIWRWFERDESGRALSRKAPQFRYPVDLLDNSYRQNPAKSSACASRYKAESMSSQEKYCQTLNQIRRRTLLHSWRAAALIYHDQTTMRTPRDWRILPIVSKDYTSDVIAEVDSSPGSTWSFDLNSTGHHCHNDQGRIKTDQPIND